MKIAFITDDELTTSEHFGRAQKYVIYTIENKLISSSEVRAKLGHLDFIEIEHNSNHDDPRGRGFGAHSEEKHAKMFKAIKDCDVLVVRGMGKGAYLGLEKSGVKVIVSDIENIKMAAKAFINGSLQNHKGKLH